MGFTERLNEVMKARGLNQVDLSEVAGLSSAQANHLVGGRTKDPKLSTAVKIAKALNVSLDWLAGASDQNSGESLTVDETALLGHYRACTDEWRSNLLMSAEAYEAQSLNAGKRLASSREELSA